MMDAFTGWLGHAVAWLTEAIFALGYPGIVVLMAVESSLFPLPSEIVLPPAGYLAAQGRMNAWLAVGAGVLGSILGAAFNYYLAVRLGRPLLHRFGRYVLVREAALVRAEDFFRRHGEISTFVGRLLPVIRHLISLPAGLARMRLDRFVIYTALGSGVWCAILTWVGWYIGLHADQLGQLPPEQVQRYLRRALVILVPAVTVLVVVYIARHRRSAAS